MNCARSASSCRAASRSRCAISASERPALSPALRFRSLGCNQTPRRKPASHVSDLKDAQKDAHLESPPRSTPCQDFFRAVLKPWVAPPKAERLTQLEQP